MSILTATPVAPPADAVVPADLTTATPAAQSDATPPVDNSIELDGVSIGYVDGILEELDKENSNGQFYARIVPLDPLASAVSMYGMPSGRKTDLVEGMTARWYCTKRGTKGNSFTYAGQDQISRASIRAGAVKAPLATKLEAAADMAARAEVTGVPVPTAGGKPKKQDI